MDYWLRKQSYMGKTKSNRMKTFSNIGDNLWLLPAHPENPHGFSSGLGFVC
jgi:hypothetical protein